MKKLLVALTIIICSTYNGCFAIDFDTTVDHEIRQKYNIEEINEINKEDIKLPELPKFKDEISPETTDKQDFYSTLQYFPKEYTGKVEVLHSGRKILLVNNSTIRDKNSRGKRITFSTMEDIYVNSITIRKGTTFRGKIQNSHTPQITGNGGLIILEIDEMIYDGYIYNINTKINKINDKHVYFGRTKGKHSYWRNVKKSCNFGIKTNRKMKKCAHKIGRVPIVGIIGIIPRTIGIATLSGNVAISPMIAVFKKGSSVSIPKGTLFEIRLTSDVKIKS